jgi:hypothetical protein
MQKCEEEGHVAISFVKMQDVDVAWGGTSITSDISFGVALPRQIWAAKSLICVRRGAHWPRVFHFQT